MSREHNIKPKKYITERIIIDKLIPGGQAIATLENGKKIFLWNALPGEIVTKTIVTKEKTSFVEGIAEDFEQVSPHRLTPRDTEYLATSPWQIMDYAYELEQKSEILKEIFRQHALDIVEDLDDLEVQTDGKDFYYRSKMEYSLYYSHEDSMIHLAFHARGSHQKVPIKTSSIERSEILVAAQGLVDELNAQHADAREYQSLVLRCNSEGRVAGGFFKNHAPRPVFDNLTDMIFDHTYSYSPNGFFQINLPVYELALREIAHHIKTKRVLDLYAGVGTIGLSVAGNAEHDLTLVECNASAYRELERNCHDRKARPVLAKSEEALEYIAPNETVILDPPRAGCDAVLTTKLLEIMPRTIIYLSCNPATQARDVKILSNKYRITKSMPYNFFPRTPHLENLMILELK